MTQATSKAGTYIKRYWAFCADPRVYRIERAIQALTEDAWTTKGKPLRAGDYAIIWKAKGKDDWRGVVAFAEVLSDPKPIDDRANPYWNTAPADVEERVEIRYLLSPNLPLKYLRDDTEAARILGTLSVARATGGTIFHVTEPQWEAVVNLAGGLPNLT